MGEAVSAGDGIDRDALGKLAHEAAWPSGGTWEDMSETTRERWRRAGADLYAEGRASRNADLDAAYRRAGVHMLTAWRMRGRALAAERALAEAIAERDFARADVARMIATADAASGLP